MNIMLSNETQLGWPVCDGSSIRMECPHGRVKWKTGGRLKTSLKSAEPRNDITQPSNHQSMQFRERLALAVRKSKLNRITMGDSCHRKTGFLQHKLIETVHYQPQLLSR